MVFYIAARLYRAAVLSHPTQIGSSVAGLLGKANAELTFDASFRKTKPHLRVEFRR